MSRIDQWPQWHTDVESTKLNGAFQPGSTFDWKSGGLNIRSTLHTVMPNSKKDGRVKHSSLDRWLLNLKKESEKQ